MEGTSKGNGPQPSGFTHSDTITVTIVPWVVCQLIYLSWGSSPRLTGTTIHVHQYTNAPCLLQIFWHIPPFTEYTNAEGFSDIYIHNNLLYWALVESKPEAHQVV